MSSIDTPAATAPRLDTIAGLDTPVAVGLIVIGALLALAGLRVGFTGAVSTSLG